MLGIAMAAYNDWIQPMTDEQVVMVFLEETGFTISHVLRILTNINMDKTLKQLEAMDDNT